MMPNPFSLEGKVAIVTGGAGFLGEQHCRAIAEAGGIPVIWDIDPERAESLIRKLGRDSLQAYYWDIDIVDEADIEAGFNALLDNMNIGGVDILVNNVANDPKVGSGNLTRLENFTIDQWHKDLDVGLMSYFLCSKIVGQHMYKRGQGVIINIASDLSVIAPDQRLYQQAGIEWTQQPVKPVTYSVIKHGIIGLTRYLASYFAPRVRVNALSPGGIFNNQPIEFLQKLEPLIPMGRMARKDEMAGALIFLCGEASSYLTGQNIIIDGGRTVI